MRIIRYRRAQGDQTIRYGFLEGDTVLEFRGNLYEHFEVGPPVAGLPDVTLLAPVMPPKIVCVGRNYAAHAAELGNAVPAEPLLFLKPPSAVVGPGDPIVLPPGVGRVDFEGELALVIRRKTRQVAPDEVPDHVLGITCLDDVTARDLQKKDRTFARAKGFDTFCPLGPTLLVDDIRRPRRIETRVDGTVRQSGSTEDMIFDVCALVSYISHIMTLVPGDVVATGTPPGVGPLAPGQAVSVEVEGVGALENPVVSGRNPGAITA